MSRFFSIIGSLLIAVAATAEYRFPVGERITYSIHWGLISCGTSTISCDEVELDGRQLIRIRITAKSNWLVSNLYPVNDRVDCFIDPVTKLSVRLEKNTSEGGFKCKDILCIDRESNTANWISESVGITTNYPVAARACDAVSFLYAFRYHEFAADEAREFNIAVDAALHGITITAGKAAGKKVGEEGEASCRKYTVTPKRDDLFVRKIPRGIWLTEDKRKILVRMDIKVPVGKVRIVLDKYIPPTE
ncbi:DUF3108 domain-containing protein [Pontiella sulfatireligans]|uniref:DUF3108 domain-containing protein n=1 Tax=Pontiella sulfatireligans TaxID=2750658 RepID=A0A6C2UR21_9BACT|nr:DUF3108 domain-containing protein [Pontiella sulfatireligans]VGO22549.1 hypothetical protein SCARR_04633 [Pontiella sulfatireligans]